MADKKPEARSTDLDKTGRANTRVETQTQVVDNTSVAPGASSMEYEVETSELSGGTILHTLMEPKGGFPQKDSEDA